MAYKSWGSASWSTSNADGQFVGGNHVALVVASVDVPNQSRLLRIAVAVPAAVAVAVAGAVSEAALIVAVVGSAEAVVVDLVEDAEEGLEIVEDLETGEAVVSGVVEAAAASEEVGTTLDHREVEVATGVGAVVWASRAVDSMTDHLLTDSEDLLDPVGLVDQVGLVLLAGVQVMVRPAAVGLVVLVVMAVTEDISSERVREDSTTETQSGHGTRFDANCTPPGEVHVGGMIAISPFLSVSSCFVCLCCLMGLVSIAWRLWVVKLSIRQVYTRVVYF